MKKNKIPKDKELDFEQTLHCILTGVLLNGYFQGKLDKSLDKNIVNLADKNLDIAAIELAKKEIKKALNK